MYERVVYIRYPCGVELGAYPVADGGNVFGGIGGLAGEGRIVERSVGWLVAFAGMGMVDEHQGLSGGDAAGEVGGLAALLQQFAVSVLVGAVSDLPAAVQVKELLSCISAEVELFDNAVTAVLVFGVRLRGYQLGRRGEDGYL